MTATDQPMGGTAGMLAALGVSGDELHEHQLARLDSDGYLRLPGVVDAQWIGELRVRLDELIDAEGAAALPGLAVATLAPC